MKQTISKEERDELARRCVEFVRDGNGTIPEFARENGLNTRSLRQWVMTRHPDEYHALVPGRYRRPAAGFCKVGRPEPDPAATADGPVRITYRDLEVSVTGCGTVTLSLRRHG